MKKVFFERAIFISWYCSRGDCKFCYMSTQKSKIKDPKKARRRKESILAEVFLCRKFNWKIEFISGGYESYSDDELVELIKEIYGIYGEKLWLNIGVLDKEILLRLKPYIKGVVGAVECINPKLHDKLCPSKPIAEILKMFKVCDELKLDKATTIIIGLGETEEDIPLLKKFIKKHNIRQITFYSLNPHEGTIFTKGPTTEYYVEWIKAIRKEFPKLKIIAGSWVNRLSEISSLLKAGADNITKFPALKLFDTKHAKKIEDEVKKAGMKLESKLSGKVDIDFSKIKLDEKVKEKIRMYVDGIGG